MGRLLLYVEEARWHRLAWIRQDWTEGSSSLYWQQRVVHDWRVAQAIDDEPFRGQLGSAI